MARFNREVEQQIRNDLKVEFGQEMGITQPLDREYERGSLSSKEYGPTSNRIMELGAKLFGTNSDKK